MYLTFIENINFHYKVSFHFPIKHIMDIVSIKIVSDSKMLENPLLFNLFNVLL